MKNLLLASLSSMAILTGFAQQTTHIWNFDGINRKYIQYIPPIYNGNEAVPLVVALHGLGDEVSNFQGVGFQAVADTANFIVVYPEALIDPLFTQATAWNSGAGTFGISLNSDVDDLGFINALIDTISAHYNIDQSKIFATGFSMGGFMSNRLACELNDRIASIASVAGPIGGELDCQPGQSIPVCHFHGTSDTQVGYGTAGGGVQDNTFGTNVSDWIAFWTSNNGCENLSIEGQFPNLANDGYIVDYQEYAGCADDSRVVHYKIHGADHTWLFRPTNDISYTTEIWKFFLGLSPDNLVPSSVKDAEIGSISIYPNPVVDELRIDGLNSTIKNVSVFNSEGKLVLERSTPSRTIDVSGLSSGIYQVMVAAEKGLFSSSFIKN
jgi:polyhydroxybutyrate depolymerase